MIFVLILAMVLSSTHPCDLSDPDTIEDVIHLEGTAKAGEDWTANAFMGQELRVISLGGPGDGWHIDLVDPAFPDDDMTSVVTPPYRGVNALHILPWHFLNASGDGPNDGSVNAPGEEREFMFVASREDYLAARATLETIMWPSSPEEVEEAMGIRDSITVYRGILLIEEMDLRPEAGTIESICFTVELERP